MIDDAAFDANDLPKEAPQEILSRENSASNEYEVLNAQIDFGVDEF